MIVRPATPADLPAVLSLWNGFIRDTTVTFTSDLKTAEGLDAMIAERRAAGREFMVAEAGGGFVGFATYAQFRGGSGYAHAMEHSIMLDPAARGQGAGRILMTAIEDHARAGGAHTLFAGVSGRTPTGWRFTAAWGFAPSRVFPRSGASSAAGSILS